MSQHPGSSTGASSVSAGSRVSSIRTIGGQSDAMITLRLKGVEYGGDGDPAVENDKVEYARRSKALRDEMMAGLTMGDQHPQASSSSVPPQASSPLVPPQTTVSVNAHAMLTSIKEAHRQFNILDTNMSDENGWSEAFIALFKPILADLKVIVTTSQKETSVKLLDIIGHPDLRQVKPDVVVGIPRKSIRIAHSSTSEAIEDVIELYIVNRRFEVPYEINQVPSSLHYFTFLFCELKSPIGNAGEGRIQNMTACFIALQILRKLAYLAREADSESFRDPTEVMHRVYGLRSEGTGQTWRLVVMKAGEGFYGSDPDDDDPRNTFSYHTIWSGDVTDRYKLVKLVALVRTIVAEVSERTEIVGNWLYCLRDAVKEATPRKRARTTRLQGSGSRASGSSRRRGPNNDNNNDSRTRDDPNTNTITYTNTNANAPGPSVSPPAGNTQTQATAFASAPGKLPTKPQYEPQPRVRAPRSKSKVNQSQPRARPSLDPILGKRSMSELSINAWISDVVSAKSDDPLWMPLGSYGWDHNCMERESE